MNRITLLLIHALLFIKCLDCITASDREQELVKVSLYYESLCPYCRQFVKDQLYPGYLKLREAIIMDLVPFGNADMALIKGKWKFNCQHGPKECLGNKMQACVLTRHIQKADKINFVGCMMSSSNPGSVEIGRNCSATYGLPWPTIHNCISSTEGDNVLAHYGDRTMALEPPLPHVPHILFNGIWNDTLETEARQDFVATVCKLFVVKPVGCS